MEATIFDCREQSTEQIIAGQARAVEKSIEIRPLGFDGIFDRFAATRSGGGELEVVRMLNFGFCACKAFLYAGTCYHLAATFPAKCPVCFEDKAPAFAQPCTGCVMDHSPYLKPTLTPKTPRVKIGGIWI